MVSDITWKIGGEAGFGIMVSGHNMARTMVRGGLFIFESNEYPSLIRGGHNTETVRISTEPVHSLLPAVHILVALNKQTIDVHKNELAPNAAVIYDSADYQLSPSDFPLPVNLFPIHLLQLAKDNGGDVLMRNTVAIGSSLALMDIEIALFTGVLTDQFKSKGEMVVVQNIAAAKAGYEFIKNDSKKNFPYALNKPQPRSKHIAITGADAIGLGAIAAGMKFFAAYPMTPINTLLHFMAGIQEKAGFIYKQPEDEIAAINMAIGASFAGVRSMVASSGGGFALMVEGTSLAGMTETPVVIVYGMRPGPATGLPTWTSQGDLKFVLNAGHGEFPRLVLAPSDVEEAFEMTMMAFNLADKYQTPVFLLTDKHLNESRQSIDPKILENHANTIPIDRGKLLTQEEQMAKDEWKRYQWTEDGISPRPIPGRKKGTFRANSDEHMEDGYSTEEADISKKMVEKRMRKLHVAQKETLGPIVYGPQDADITLVGWGSTKGVVLEALNLLKNEDANFKVNYIQLSWINPFPKESLTQILQKAKKLIDVEGSHNAPMADYIHEQTGIKITDKILKYDGRPFFPEEIIEGIKNYG